MVKMDGTRPNLMERWKESKNIIFFEISAKGEKPQSIYPHTIHINEREMNGGLGGMGERRRIKLWVLINIIYPNVYRLHVYTRTIYG